MEKMKLAQQQLRENKQRKYAAKQQTRQAHHHYVPIKSDHFEERRFPPQGVKHYPGQNRMYNQEVDYSR